MKFQHGSGNNSKQNDREKQSHQSIIYMNVYVHLISYD